jgi:hypothetical protein
LVEATRFPSLSPATHSDAETHESSPRINEPDRAMVPPPVAPTRPTCTVLLGGLNQ